MKRLGFIRLISDAGIFIHRHLKVIVIAYVDDCVFMGKDLNKVKTLKSQYMEIWECRDLGDAKEFLKMQITQIGNKIILDQRDYLNAIVKRFDMAKSQSCRTPLPLG